MKGRHEGEGKSTPQLRFCILQSSQFDQSKVDHNGIVEFYYPCKFLLPPGGVGRLANRLLNDRLGINYAPLLRVGDKFAKQFVLAGK